MRLFQAIITALLFVERVGCHVARIWPSNVVYDTRSSNITNTTSTTHSSFDLRILCVHSFNLSK